MRTAQLILGASMLAASSSSALTTAEIVQKAKPAVVAIIQEDWANKQSFIGTGWFMDSKTIVTNSHVIKGSFNVLRAYRITDGKEFVLDHINYDNPKDDVAVLTINDAYSSESYLRLAEAPPLEGENVTVIGNPKEHYGTVTTGIVSAIRDTIMQISAPISHGSSGSPVLNNDGDVVGMVWGGDAQSDAHDLNYSVLYTHLKNDITGVTVLNIGNPLLFSRLVTQPAATAVADRGTDSYTFTVDYISSNSKMAIWIGQFWLSLDQGTAKNYFAPTIKWYDQGWIDSVQAEAILTRDAKRTPIQRTIYYRNKATVYVRSDGAILVQVPYTYSSGRKGAAKINGVFNGLVSIDKYNTMRFFAIWNTGGTTAPRMIVEK
jgi:S1-C subfamily serine protease